MRRSGRAGLQQRRDRFQPAVASGDYLVSITVDGKTMSRVLRVERVSGTGGGGVFAFDDN